QDHFVSVKQLLYPQTLHRQQQKSKKMTFFFQVDFTHILRMKQASACTIRHPRKHDRKRTDRNRKKPPCLLKAGEFHPIMSTQFVTLRFHISSMHGIPPFPAVPVNLSHPKYPRKPPASR
ncbi:hypothetical protein ACH0C8_03795, partial [Acetobacter lovaniensis]|uniref:hypothetical protein n=1 Tax=Acetobacter lovaniensis TaxID=104100 RepID=UPI00376F92D1